MKIGLLLNWFTDIGRSVRNGLGEVGVIVFMVAFFFIAACLLYAIIRNALIVVKPHVAWGSVVFLIVFSLLFIWFATIL